MPEPTEGEEKNEFMKRCVPAMMDEGMEQDQAVAVCMAKFEKGGKSVKAGSRHSAKDHEHLRNAIEEIVQAGGTHERMGDLLAPTIKADAEIETALYISLPDVADAVKAAGDWELDVLGVPFGGPNNGKDSQGQFFSQKTKTYLDLFKIIPVFYYHSVNPDGRGLQRDPELIGKAEYTRTDERGHWFRVILDRASKFAGTMWQAAKDGIARASSGSLNHLVRVGRDGEITHWPVAELSLIDAKDGRRPANAYAVAAPVMKAAYDRAGLNLPVITLEQGDNKSEKDNPANGEADGQSVNSVNAAAPQSQKENIKMDENVAKEVQAAVKAALDEAKAKADAEKAAQEKFEAEVKARVEKEVEAVKAEAAASRRLPDGAPYVAKFADLNRYDNLDASEAAVMIGVLESAKVRVSPQAYKALAIKSQEDTGEVGKAVKPAMKAVGITDAVKTDYANFTTSTSGGTEWVGTAYSTALWEAIRLGTFVVQKLPQIEVPQGMSSIYLPFENTDPTWYNVAQYAPTSGAVDVMDGTVTASRLQTGRQQLTLGKMGARVIWSQELDEDSLIPWVGQLRDQLAKSGAEYLESAIIDGDTTTAAGNINSSTATSATGTYYLIWDGFRHLPLVTETGNARSAAGSLDVTDYLETVKLMGTAGINGLEQGKVSFIVDPTTYYKTMTLPEVLTRDVYSNPVLENGRLTGLWGYPLNVSANMCKTDSSRMSTLTGIIDDGSLTKYGSILAVRWDQWKFGWKRRMTMETTRVPRADASEIVAMFRCGLKFRDNEAAAITYYVGV